MCEYYKLVSTLQEHEFNDQGISSKNNVRDFEACVQAKDQIVNMMWQNAQKYKTKDLLELLEFPNINFSKLVSQKAHKHILMYTGIMVKQKIFTDPENMDENNK